MTKSRGALAPLSPRPTPMVVLSLTNAALTTLTCQFVYGGLSVSKETSAYKFNISLTLTLLTFRRTQKVVDPPGSCQL